eukprot:XP_022280004.1 uncharacterized protein LOC102153479 [Canis lupus familiaris]
MVEFPENDRSVFIILGGFPSEPPPPAVYEVQEVAHGEPLGPRGISPTCRWGLLETEFNHEYWLWNEAPAGSPDTQTRLSFQIGNTLCLLSPRRQEDPHDDLGPTWVICRRPLPYKFKPPAARSPPGSPGCTLDTSLPAQVRAAEPPIPLTCTCSLHPTTEFRVVTLHLTVGYPTAGTESLLDDNRSSDKDPGTSPPCSLSNAPILGSFMPPTARKRQ